jgi:hypothetical protein
MQIVKFGSTKTIKWWYYIIMLILVVGVPILLTILAVVNRHIGSPSYTMPVPNSLELIHKSKIKLCWFQSKYIERALYYNLKFKLSILNF